MKSAIVAATAVAVLTFGMGVARAASVGGSNAPDHTPAQQSVQVTPGYRVGTGVAHVGDGSDPSYYTPGFSGGTGAARVGDGSDPGYLATQHYLESSPGRGGGNG